MTDFSIKRPSSKSLIWGGLLCLIIVFFMYVTEYYKAGDIAINATKSTEEVTVSTKDNIMFFDGKGTSDAIIFYPGAKVEYTAYAPILKQLAKDGTDCFLIKMPFNMALFDYDAAGEVLNNYSYEHYYLMGHSMGGAFAATYASKNLDKFDGIIFLAAYPVNNLKKDGFKALSLYGSEDGVLHMNKLVAGRKYMPGDYTEIKIEGGNHAGFADYGWQKGDNKASITEEEQWQITVEAIENFLEYTS